MDEVIERLAPRPRDASPQPGLVEREFAVANVKNYASAALDTR
jgi:hypothetical protein